MRSARMKKTLQDIILGQSTLEFREQPVPLGEGVVGQAGVSSQKAYVTHVDLEG